MVEILILERMLSALYFLFGKVFGMSHFPFSV